MKTWLDKLCEPLEHPKYPQIKGTLCKKTPKKYLGLVPERIVGKCAQGEIACQNNIKYKENQNSLTKSDFIILGVPEDLLDARILPYIGHDIEDGVTNLHNLIYNFNDCGYTYPEIAEFLRTTFEDAV